MVGSGIGFLIGTAIFTGASIACYRTSCNPQRDVQANAERGIHTAPVMVAQQPSYVAPAAAQVAYAAAPVACQTVQSAPAIISSLGQVMNKPEVPEQQGMPTGVLICGAGFLIILPMILAAFVFLKPNKRRE